MSRMSRVAAFAFLAALLAAPASVAGPGSSGHSHDHLAFSAGEPGNPKRKSRTIEIVMLEGDGKMLFKPNRIEVKRGEQIRFVLKNAGELDHEFVLATPEENKAHAVEMQKNPDMEHDDPNAKKVAPKRTGEILWRFTKRGEFEFACLIPGHFEAGMRGTIVVK